VEPGCQLSRRCWGWSSGARPAEQRCQASEKIRCASQPSIGENASIACFSPTSRGEVVRFWQLLIKFGIWEPIGTGNLLELFLISKISEMVVFGIRANLSNMLEMLQPNYSYLMHRNYFYILGNNFCSVLTKSNYQENPTTKNKEENPITKNRVER
jgi:hypothetical protein